MSEQENNLCETCGGLKRIAYTIEFRECAPHSISVNPGQFTAPFKLCPGHPEPTPKHDGGLGNDLRVHYDDNLDDPWDLANKATYKGVRVSNPYGYMPLTPAQALLLLAWLRQEEVKLQRLAKEQGE